MALKKPIFIGHEIYRDSSYGGSHPLRIPRMSTLIDLTRALGWLPDDQFRAAPRVKPAAVTHWHDPDYVAALQAAEREGAVSGAVRARHAIGTHMNPVFPEIWRRPATTAGGSLLAGELLADGGIVHHPAGGTHHAFPDRAGGFCYLNDPVLAMLSLRRNGVRRLAYVDIDAHHPDGVEHGFAGDPDCLMISVHEAGRWPGTGQITDEGVGQVYNMPVPAGLNDSEMAEIRERLIVPLVRGFGPDAVILQCGADAVEEDPLSRLSLSNRAHFEIVRGVIGLSPRLLVLGGGGYNPWSVGRLWAGVWGLLNGHALSGSLPDAAEAVLRDLRFEGNSRGRNPPEAWFTTLIDAPRRGAVRAKVAGALRYLCARAGM